MGSLVKSEKAKERKIEKNREIRRRKRIAMAKANKYGSKYAPKQWTKKREGTGSKRRDYEHGYDEQYGYDKRKKRGKYYNKYYDEYEYDDYQYENDRKSYRTSRGRGRGRGSRRGRGRGRGRGYGGYDGYDGGGGDEGHFSGYSRRKGHQT